jgi:hypothetical protein
MLAMEVSASIFWARGELARQGVDGEHGQLALGHRLHEIGVLRRPDEAEERAAGLHQRDFVGRRGTHPEDHVGGGAKLRGAARDAGAGGLVGLVAEVGRCAGPGLDGDAEAELDQLLDHLGHGGDTLLTRERLARYSDH